MEISRSAARVFRSQIAVVMRPRGLTGPAAGRFVFPPFQTATEPIRAGLIEGVFAPHALRREHRRPATVIRDAGSSE